MSKKEVDRLNGDLKRLETIQKVLLSTHAGKVPDGYVNVLVEEIKFLWKKNAKADTEPLEVSEPKNDNHEGWVAKDKSAPKVKFIPHKNPTKPHPEGWDA